MKAQPNRVAATETMKAFVVLVERVQERSLETAIEGPNDGVGMRFRGGRVSKAHKLMYHLTLGSRVIKRRELGGGNLDEGRRKLR